MYFCIRLLLYAMYKSYFILFFIFILVPSSFAQGNYFEYLTTQDGLSDYSINSLYEDEYARMWIATRNGLNCYDGQRFRIWNASQGLKDTYVRRVVGDHAQHLLIQTRAHAFVMDLKNENITPLPTRSVSTIAANSSGLWVATTDTVYQVIMQPQPYLKPILVSSGITSIAPVDSQTIWVASNEGVQLYIKGHATGTLFPDIQHVISFLLDSRHNLWVCTRGDGLYTVSPQLQLTQHYTAQPNNPNSLTDNDVRCITEDFLGNYWVGLYGGLCHINPQTGHIQRYEYDPRAEHALSTFSVWALATDQQGTVWIGTFFGGIDLINPQYSIYTFYGAYGKEGRHLSNPIITGSCMDGQKNLWIGTNGGGINYLNPTTNRIEHIRIDTKNPQPAVKSLWLDSKRNHLWIGTHRGGLMMMDTQTRRITPIALPDNNIRKLIGCRDTLWVLSQHDLYTINLQNMQVQKPVPSYAMPTITGEFGDMALRNDEIWFAHSNLLYCYSSSNKQTYKYPFEANITVLCTDESQRLLIGTDTRGVWLLTDSGYVDIKAINQHLVSPYIMSVVSKKEDYVITSNVEVCAFNKDWQLYSSFTTTNGLPLEVLVEHSAAIYDHSILVGGVNGLVLCPIHSPQHNITPSALHVSNILIDDKQPQLETSYPFVKTIQLSPSNHTLTLQVTTSGFVTRRNSNLRYRLRNYDHDWITTNNNALISYTNLPKGRYVLEIECIGTPLRREISIQVQPHWYNSWWGWTIYFVIAIILLTIGLMRFGRYVEKKTRKQINNSYHQDLQRATTIVMNHLADDTFNVQKFAKEMYVSRTGLFTKLQEIAGQTPNDFIMSIRMREAATLLRTDATMSIVDIGIRVGFNSTSYFIKCFHRFYGKSPASWRKENKPSNMVR